MPLNLTPAPGFRGGFAMPDRSHVQVFRDRLVLSRGAGVEVEPVPAFARTVLPDTPLPATTCPICSSEGNIVVVTTDAGLDWLWHPECRGWHCRLATDTAVEDALCPVCELFVSPGQSADDPTCDRCADLVEARRQAREWHDENRAALAEERGL